RDAARPGRYDQLDGLGDIGLRRCRHAGEPQSESEQRFHRFFPFLLLASRSLKYLRASATVPTPAGPPQYAAACRIASAMSLRDRPFFSATRKFATSSSVRFCAMRMARFMKLRV